MPRFARSTLALLISTIACSASAGGYTISVLDVGAGSYTRAFGINAAGQVTGDVSGTNYANHAALWTNGTLSALDNGGHDEGVGIALNDAGVVAGFVNDWTGQFHAATWTNGTLHTLPTLGGTTGLHMANGINNAGQIVGRSVDTLGQDRAVLWNGGSITDLGTLGGTLGIAFGINNHGQAVGFSTRSDGSYGATLWENGKVIDLSSGVSSASANAINDSGVAAGTLEQPYFSGAGAVQWTGGVPSYLGTFGGNYSYANAINNAGVIVGKASFSGSTDSHATVWVNGQAVDLNNMIVGDRGGFGVLSEVNGINDAGQIVGTAFVQGLGSRAFVLTPVPEPETWAMMLSGLLLIGAAARRKR
jgi:probable HAF family extracellular repeat protein